MRNRDMKMSGVQIVLISIGLVTAVYFVLVVIFMFEGMKKVHNHHVHGDQWQMVSGKVVALPVRHLTQKSSEMEKTPSEKLEEIFLLGQGSNDVGRDDLATPSPDPMDDVVDPYVAPAAGMGQEVAAADLLPQAGPLAAIKPVHIDGLPQPLVRRELPLPEPTLSGDDLDPGCPTTVVDEKEAARQVLNQMIQDEADYDRAKSPDQPVGLKFT